MSEYTPFKMKGFSGFANSPAKQKDDKKKKLQGPIPEKNIKLQPGEREGSWVYPAKGTGDDFVRRERMIDYDERAGVLEQNELADLEGDKSPKANKKRKQLKKTIKKLDHERDLISDRTQGPSKKRPPFKLMGLLKKKVNKELDTPAGKAAMGVATGGMA